MVYYTWLDSLLVSDSLRSFVYYMAVVAKWTGRRPGNRKVPGSMPGILAGIDPWLLLCFLGQETYPSPSHPAIKPDIL